mgnify:CR=1 FL=1
MSPSHLQARSGQGTEGLTGLAGWVADVIEALGAVGVGLLIALENLFPPIPSEVVLPLAGFLAAEGRMHPVAVLVAATIGALFGALVLYGLGAWLGEERIRRLVRRVPLLQESDLDRAVAWFQRYGRIAVLVGRMVPVVRSLISVPAGVERMPLPQFILLTTLGSLIWNSVFIGLGITLGERWRSVGHYSDWINTAILVLLVGAIAWFVIGRLRRRRSASRPGPSEQGGVGVGKAPNDRDPRRVAPSSGTDRSDSA